MAARPAQVFARPEEGPREFLIHTRERKARPGIMISNALFKPSTTQKPNWAKNWADAARAVDTAAIYWRQRLRQRRARASRR